MAKNKENAAPQEETAAEVRFSKGQLLTCERFREKRDLLNALLSAEEKYTVKAVEKIINNYLKGEV